MRVMLKSAPYRTRAGLFVPAGHVADVEDDEGIALIKSGYAMPFQGKPPERVEKAVANRVREDAMERRYDESFIPAPPFPVVEAPKEDENQE